MRGELTGREVRDVGFATVPVSTSAGKLICGVLVWSRERALIGFTDEAVRCAPPGAVEEVRGRLARIVARATMVARFGELTVDDELTRWVRADPWWFFGPRRLRVADGESLEQVMDSLLLLVFAVCGREAAPEQALEAA